MFTASSPPPASGPAAASAASAAAAIQEQKAKLAFTDQPIVSIATCNLNQFALDFAGNQERIIKSIRLAVDAGCTYRLGPELEITGYSCEDHFYELDTITFAWMSLRDIILNGVTNNILCDFGMPVLHNGVRYNCRVFVLGRKILLIRPKMWMADDGNYREDRHFTPWDKDKIEHMEEYQLPEAIHSALDMQTTAPFGVAILQCNDATIGAEICEELFTAESTNILLGFEGCDIMSNGSASHFEVGKLARRHELIKEATKKNGGIYMYSNMIGCDGNRLVFDGNGMIYINGELKAIGEHCKFDDVEVVTAKLNLNEVRTYRAKSVSHQMQSDQRSKKLQRVKVNFNLTKSLGAAEVGKFEQTETITPAPSYRMEEEMGLAVSRWMFDYLTRSGSGSFLLPLSGGVDSSSTAIFVYFMCSIIVDKLTNGTEDQKEFLHQRLDLHVFRNDPTYAKYMSRYSDGRARNFKKTVEQERQYPTTIPTVEQLVNVILYTVNMPTKNNTSKIMLYALNLAKALGSYHITAEINDAFNGIKDIVKNLTFGYKFSKNTNTSDVIGVRNPLNPSDIFTKAEEVATPEETVQIPRTAPRDGWEGETLAIQNIQARLRMMCAFYLAQILPLHRNVVGKMGGELETYQAAKQIAEEAGVAADADVAADKKAQARRENSKFVAYLSKAGKDLHEKYKPAVYGAQMCLVLASSNSDEALRGFYTKYDAASADINPIGSFSKHDLRRFLFYCMGTKFTSSPYSEAFDEDTIKDLPAEGRSNLKFKILWDILTVVASPELQEPGAKVGDQPAQIQDDEIAITYTYEDLYDFGIMRQQKLGPLGMFYKMCRDRLGKSHYVIEGKGETGRKEMKVATPNGIFEIIRRLITQFGTNRHKMTILTPAVHATAYSPDDNRFDQRPFLYPNLGDLESYQLNTVKLLAAEMEKRTDVQAKIALASASAPTAAAAAGGSSISGRSNLPTSLPFGGAAATTAAGTELSTELGGGARRNLTHLRRVTRDKKREAKRRSKTRKN